MNFFVGEVVEHIRWGVDVTIVEPAAMRLIAAVNKNGLGTPRRALAYGVESSDGKLNPRGKNLWAAEPHDLRRKRPPTGQWSECVWKPENLEVT